MSNVAGGIQDEPSLAQARASAPCGQLDLGLVAVARRLVFAALLLHLYTAGFALHRLRLRRPLARLPGCPRPRASARCAHSGTHLKHTRPPHPRRDLLLLPLLLPLPLARARTPDVPRNHLDEVHAALPALEPALVRPRNQVRVRVDVAGGLPVVLGQRFGLSAGLLAFGFGGAQSELEARIVQVPTQEGGAADGVREGGVGDDVGEGCDLVSVWAEQEGRRGVGEQCVG